MTSKLNSAVNYAEHCLQMFIIHFFFFLNQTSQVRYAKESQDIMYLWH